MQVIYDLLERSSGHLELREDPEQGIIVAGLRCIKVHFFLLLTVVKLRIAMVDARITDHQGLLKCI